MDLCKLRALTCLFLLLALLAPREAGTVSYRERGLLRLLFKHGQRQQERGPAFYADLRTDLLRRAGSKRRLLASLEQVELSALDSVTGIDVLEAPAGEAAGLLLRALQQHPDMEFAEEDAPLHAFGSAEPNDPDLPQQWAMFTLGLFDAPLNGSSTGSTGSVAAASALPRAWSRTTGSGNVTVCVIDSGVDYNHPDLQGNLWVNEGEIPFNGIDDDENGFIDDYYGFNFLNNTGNTMDDNYHGTHLAGIVGARTGNGVGVAGVAPHVAIMPCKFLDSKGNGYTSDAIRCMAYALQMGADITLNSYGGADAASQALQSAISNAEAAGQLFVTAAGNEYGWDIDATPVYPASYASGNMLTVAAVNQGGGLADYSNYGAKSTHLAAPGSSVLSTVPGASYGRAFLPASHFAPRFHDGTSQAAGFVAGAAALLLAAYQAAGYDPSGMAAAVKGTILQSAARSPALANTSLTGGMLDVAAAMALVPIAGSLQQPPPAAVAAAPGSPQQMPGGVSLGGGGAPVNASASAARPGGNTTTATSLGDTQQLPDKPGSAPAPVQMLVPLNGQGGAASLAFLAQGSAGYTACAQAAQQLPNPPQYGADVPAGLNASTGSLIDLPGPVGVRGSQVWRVAVFANGSLALLAAGSPPAANGTTAPPPQPVVLRVAAAGAGNFSLGADARVSYFNPPDRLVLSFEGAAWGGSAGTLQAELFLQPGRLPPGSLRLSWLASSGDSSVPAGLAIAVTSGAAPGSASAAPAACLLPPVLQVRPGALPAVTAAPGDAIPPLDLALGNGGNASLQVEPGGRELLRPDLWLNQATGYTRSFAQSGLTCQQFQPDTDPICVAFPPGGGLSLRGALLGAPIRLAEPLAPPLQLRAGILRTTQCANQWLALSVRPQAPSFFGEPGTLWLLMLCGKKYLYAPGGSLISDAACADFGANSLDIRVGATAVEFRDDDCPPMAAEHGLPPGRPLHLFLGSLCAYAGCSEGSQWQSLQLITLGPPGWRLAAPAPGPSGSQQDEPLAGSSAAPEAAAAVGQGGGSLVWSQLGANGSAAAPAPQQELGDVQFSALEEAVWAPPVWASVQPPALTVAAGSAAKQLSLRLQGDRLTVGQHSASLVIRSNDPDTRVQRLPLNVSVTG